MAQVSLEDRALDLLRFLGAEQTSPGAGYVLLMGTTGSGKSTFISRCTGHDVGVGHELRSCTDDVGVFHFFDGERDIYLIDTPGFDDTSRSDIDTLRVISYYLGLSFANGNRIDGIIYLHRISDVRFTGTCKRTVDMLKSLAGERVFPNITIATTMWDSKPEQYLQQLNNEKQLRAEPSFFGDLVNQGAHYRRHAEHGGGRREEITSAKSVIASVLQDTVQDLKLAGLQIQREMITLNLQLDDTAAGRTLLTIKSKDTQQLLKQSDVFESQRKAALSTHNADLAEEMRRRQKEVQDTLAKMRVDNETLRRSMQQIHEAETKKLVRRLDKLEKERREASQRKEDELARLQAEMAKLKDEARRYKQQQRQHDHPHQRRRTAQTPPAAGLRPPNRHPSSSSPSSTTPAAPRLPSPAVSPSRREQDQDQYAQLLTRINDVGASVTKVQKQLADTKAQEQDGKKATGHVKRKIAGSVGKAVLGAAMTAGFGAVAAVACSVM